MEAIGVDLLFVTMKGCTAQAPNYHPNADEFCYALKGRPLGQGRLWGGGC